MDTKQEVSALRAEVEALRADLAQLRERLANEVRTRRVIVQDADTVERIVLAVHDDGSAAVEVAANRNADDEIVTGIELFAQAPQNRPAEAGLAITFEEDVVASLDCLAGTTILNLP